MVVTEVHVALVRGSPFGGVMLGAFISFFKKTKTLNGASVTADRLQSGIESWRLLDTGAHTIKLVEMGASQPIESDVKLTFLDPPEKAGVWYVLSARKDRIYKVNLDLVTCNCDHFSRVPINTLKTSSHRFCAHLVRKARELGFCQKTSPSSELIDFYLRTEAVRKGCIGKKFYLAEFNSNVVLAVSRLGSHWFEVFSRKKKTADKDTLTGDVWQYGYYPEGNRWSYGDAPFRPVPIKNWLNYIKKDQNVENFTSAEADDNSNHTESGFPLMEIFEIDPSSGILDTEMVTAIFEHLRSIKKIETVHDALLKLQSYQGVSVSSLGKEWLAHGLSLSSQGRAEAASTFLDKAQEINSQEPRNSSTHTSVATRPQGDMLSLEESDLARQKLFRFEQGSLNIPLIDIDKERERFFEVSTGKLKLEANAILALDAPKWYDKNVGHTYFGYLYADFVRDNVSPGATSRITDTKRVIMDYFASLAIFDNTISNNTMAVMLRLKGDFALDRREIGIAICYYKRSLIYNPSIGIRKQLKQLESLS
jgi:tetratricopeptide (TPR) repeat protein